ncbi:MAG: GAF domain-containing SpoIIE family protein phosphatase [Verrucomicrobiota bacterium]
MNTVLIVIVILLLLACIVLLLRSGKLKNESIDRLLKEEQAIVEEERRLFSFLHDLGESIARVDTQAAMYRLIVEGAMKVMESTGGALYLLDASERSLVPRHHSDKCAPLVALPERIASMARANRPALLSFLRLHPVTVTEGLLGSIFQNQKVEILTDLSAEPRVGGFGGNMHGETTVIIGPLNSGTKKLGVLAVTAPKDKREYNSNDFEVFRSLVEQCAFALANAMAHQAATEKKQIELELKSASDVQRILLPSKAPHMPGFTIAGKNIPATVLSGDYFDFIPLVDGSLGIVIADVSGKGTAAALITAMCRSVLRFSADGAAAPAATLAAVNRHIFPDIRENRFITLIYLVAAADGSSFKLARAGHTRPLVWRKLTGQVEILNSGGLAVGIDKGNVFERVTKDLTFHLSQGDTLLLYTDGVNEAMDIQGEEFGEERIHTTLAALAPQGPQAVIDGLIYEVDQFSGGRRCHDDITLVVLQKS